MGDLHVGADADAKKVGVPLYPGARLKVTDDNNGQANLSLLTEAFGMKLIVANYVSNDAPEKILNFYRDKLKRYGKVLECHSAKHGGDVSVHDDKKDSSKSKELKCDENSGPVTELKVGTEDNQRVVAVEPEIDARDRPLRWFTCTLGARAQTFRGSGKFLVCLCPEACDTFKVTPFCSLVACRWSNPATNAARWWKKAGRFVRTARHR